MDPILLSLIGSTVASIIGRTLERPKRPSTDWLGIQRNLEASIQRRVSGEATGAQQQAGQIAASRGLTGGAAAQVVGQAGAPVRAAGEAEMVRVGADIMRAQGQEKDVYNQQKSAWKAGMFGDVAEGLGGIAGMLAQRENLDAIHKILANAYGGTQGNITGGSGMEKNKTPIPQFGGQTGMSGGNFTPMRNDGPLDVWNPEDWMNRGFQPNFRQNWGGR